MESLTRNNYEIWFLDYLDGQLSNVQLETLLDFLELNPDLKEELRGVSGVSLTAGMESLDQKEQLLKSPADIPGIGAIDQLCIARLEDDLTDEEVRMFDIRLEKDPELEREYAAFQLTRLNQSDSAFYPNKRDLRKKVVVFSPWIITAISSAAVVLLAWFLWPDPPETITQPLAKIEQPSTRSPQPATRSPQATTNRRPPITSNLLSSNRKPSAANPVKSKSANEESIQREIVPLKSISRKSVVAGPRIPDPLSTKMLFASSYPSVLIDPVTQEDALTLPQYALQLFREKILGEDRILVRRTRFSMWEVAGVGVNKINDLAGTKMKINREYDSKGDILAVSFNSRLIDVESPIKGQENR